MKKVVHVPVPGTYYVKVFCGRVGKMEAADDLKLATCLTCLKGLMKEKQREKQRKEEEWREASRDLNEVERRLLAVSAKRGPA